MNNDALTMIYRLMGDDPRRSGPYATRHNSTSASRHDRKFTKCILCGGKKSPDRAFCSPECCKEHKAKARGQS